MWKGNSGGKEKTDDNSGHYVIASSRLPVILNYFSFLGKSSQGLDKISSTWYLILGFCTRIVAPPSTKWQKTGRTRQGNPETPQPSSSPAPVPYLSRFCNFWRFACILWFIDSYKKDLHLSKRYTLPTWPEFLPHLFSLEILMWRPVPLQLFDNFFSFVISIIISSNLDM